MKIRTNFVSNSSSASFIINWKSNSFNSYKEEEMMDRALSILFGEGWDKDAKEQIEEIKKITVVNSDNTYTTSFWTSMMNSGDDFGELAKSFTIKLMCAEEDGFKMISYKIENDY